MLKKQEIVSKMEETLKKESMEEIIGEIKTLKSEFVELVTAEHSKLEEAFIADGNEKADFKPPHDEYDSKFSDLMTKFNQRKKTHEDQKLHEYGQNLETKKKIIADLNKLIEEEQHIGHAFEKFNALKDKWKEVGNVAASEYKDLQREYSQTLERFFYNINIYKTLKEYDLQKNLQLKKELTDKVKKLMDVKSIREVRDLINTYTKDWDEIGPTHQNQWEKVRDEFWDSVKAVHKKIGDYYQKQKEDQKENFEKKSALCVKAEELSKQNPEDRKQWNKVFKELDSIRDEWKKIGFAGKGKNDQVWERFKESTSKLNAKRREFQSEVKADYAENEQKKKALIERAKSLQDSVDWKKTAEDLKRLQQDWKRVGSTFPNKEQKLWKAFRGASDHFFNKRKEFFDGREDREKENLKLKKALLKKLEGIKPGKTELGKLEEISKEWNTIGFVPIKEKGAVESKFQEMLKSKLEKSGLAKSDVEEKAFSMKVEGIKEADNSDDLIRKEYRSLDDQLKKVLSTIQQYENNLGFFGGNVEGNPLVKDVMDKIEASKSEAEKIKSRMQLLDQ